MKRKKILSKKVLLMKLLQKHLNMTLPFILWSLSVLMTFYMISLFGWKPNQPYEKKDEHRYKKQIDIICYLTLSVWCLLALFNLVLYGPLR